VKVTWLQYYGWCNCIH